jgi:hypothetical protein
MQGQSNPMAMKNIFLIFIFFVLVCANISATFIVIRNEFSGNRKIFLQIMFVWLVPVFGAMIVYALFREPKSRHRGSYREKEELGENPNVGLRNASKDYFDDSANS